MLTWDINIQLYVFYFIYFIYCIYTDWSRPRLYVCELALFTPSRQTDYLLFIHCTRQENKVNKSTYWFMYHQIQIKTLFISSCWIEFGWLLSFSCCLFVTASVCRGLWEGEKTKPNLCKCCLNSHNNTHRHVVTE